MRELTKESWVPAEKSENGDSKPKGLLPICDSFGGNEGGWRTFNGVFEEHGGFEIGLFVDYMVEGLVLDPFEADFGYGPPLLVVGVGEGG